MIARQKDITPVPRTKGIIIGLSQMAETIENNISQIPKQFDLSKVCVTDKYGFPELIYPGTSRNDFYLTLESGEFSIDKTFEIQIIIKMNNGENLPVSFPPSLSFRFPPSNQLCATRTAFVSVHRPRDWCLRTHPSYCIIMVILDGMKGSLF